MDPLPNVDDASAFLYAYQSSISMDLLLGHLGFGEWLACKAQHHCQAVVYWMSKLKASDRKPFCSFMIDHHLN